MSCGGSLTDVPLIGGFIFFRELSAKKEALLRIVSPSLLGVFNVDALDLAVGECGRLVRK